MKVGNRQFVVSGKEREFLEEKIKKLPYRKHSVLRNRIRAIILLGAERKRKEEVAKICKINQSTLYKWVSRYQEEGFRGLKIGPYPVNPPG